MCPVFIIPDQWITYSCYDLYIFCFTYCWHQAELLKSNSLCSAACVSPLAVGRGCRDNPGPFTLGFGTCKKLLAEEEVQSLICECVGHPLAASPESKQKAHISAHVNAQVLFRVIVKKTRLLK